MVGSAATTRRGTICRDGDRWVVALDGHRVRVANLVGMQYLADLLTRPGQYVSALSLAGHGTSPPPVSQHELLDDAARTANAARAQELTTELAEAEADNDLVRARHRPPPDHRADRVIRAG